MPKSRANKSKQNRDFLMAHERYVKDNYLKWLDLATKHMMAVTDLKLQEINFMLFCYDYEFFSMEHIAETYGRSKKKLYDRIVYPLKKRGYIEDYYSHGRSSAAVEQMLGITHKSTKLALSSKGKQAVQRYYRFIDGREEIAYHDLGRGGRPIG